MTLGTTVIFSGILSSVTYLYISDLGRELQAAARYLPLVDGPGIPLGLDTPAPPRPLDAGVLLESVRDVDATGRPLPDIDGAVLSVAPAPTAVPIRPRGAPLPLNDAVALPLPRAPATPLLLLLV